MPKGLQGFQKGNQLGKGCVPTNGFKKGYVPWNKGRKCPEISASKIGQAPWNKGIKYDAIAGEKHYNWKGGKKFHNGYILVRNREHPFCGDQGYVFEHRLVMEKHLGRILDPKEVVHHINGIVDDNRIENLKLFANNGNHISETLTGIPKKKKHITP